MDYLSIVVLLTTGIQRLHFINLLVSDGFYVYSIQRKNNNSLFSKENRLLRTSRMHL